jgi:hypothetical protein
MMQENNKQNKQIRGSLPWMPINELKFKHLFANVIIILNSEKILKGLGYRLRSIQYM